MTETTTLYLANGLQRTVRGRAEDIGRSLRRRTMSNDDRLRQFTTTDGDTITINADAVLMTEAAATRTGGTFGFARALEAA